MRHDIVILGRTFALSSGAVGSTGSVEPPEWFLVLPRGEVRIEDGPPALMDDEAARLVLAHFADLSHDMVIDYEHQTLKDGVAPASGWIKDLEWRTDGEKPGLWARAEWTDKAAQHIRLKEYRYHSPVLVRRKSDNRIAQLHNVALTNQPRMKDAVPLAAKYTPNLHEGDEDMKNLEVLKKELGLEASADEAAVLKAIADLKAGKVKAEGDLEALKKAPPVKGAADKDTELVACKEVLTALGLAEGVDKAKVLGAVEALKAPASASGELAKTVEILKSELGGIKAEGLIQEALKNGKTSPAELDAWGRKMAQDQPEMFRTVVLARAEGSVVPLKDIKTVVGQDDGGALTDDQRKINGMMGISEEAWKKHNPEAAK